MNYIRTGATVLATGRFTIKQLRRDTLTCPEHKSCQCTDTHTSAYILGTYAFHAFADRQTAHARIKIAWNKNELPSQFRTVKPKMVILPFKTTDQLLTIKNGQ